MPYIKDEFRRQELLRGLLGCDPHDKGELNFVICQVVQNYLLGQDPKELGYTELSEAGDAVIDAYLEYVRCVLVPYEERRRLENGDVWEINQILK